MNCQVVPAPDSFFIGGEVVIVKGNVVHTEMFTAKKDGKVYTKLFVPVGYDVVAVIANGDLTPLAGVCEVPFRLGVRDGNIKLFYAGEEV